MDAADRESTGHRPANTIGAAYTPPPKTYRGNHCPDCGTPISKYSRGRCRVCGGKARMRVMPSDFSATLKKLGSQGAAEHYRASLGTVTRWRRELGMQPHSRALRNLAISMQRGTSFRPRPIYIYRDPSSAGQAVDFLRRYGPIFRCHDCGKAASEGRFWNRNGYVLTEDDVISRATRLGWKAA